LERIGYRLGVKQTELLMEIFFQRSFCQQDVSNFVFNVQDFHVDAQLYQCIETTLSQIMQSII
jgi:hypothetical protein